MDWLLLGRHMLLSLLIVVVMLFALPMAQAWAAEQAWTVHRTADGFQLASDALTLEIDTERATLRSVVVGDRSIVPRRGCSKGRRYALEGAFPLEG
jgi:hypothetical protein